MSETNRTRSTPMNKTKFGSYYRLADRGDFRYNMEFYIKTEVDGKVVTEKIDTKKFATLEAQANKFEYHIFRNQAYVKVKKRKVQPIVPGPK